MSKFNVEISIAPKKTGLIITTTARDMAPHFINCTVEEGTPPLLALSLVMQRLVDSSRYKLAEKFAIMRSLQDSLS